MINIYLHAVCHMVTRQDAKAHLDATVRSVTAVCDVAKLCAETLPLRAVLHCTTPEHYHQLPMIG